MGRTYSALRKGASPSNVLAHSGPRQRRGALLPLACNDSPSGPKSEPHAKLSPDDPILNQGEAVAVELKGFDDAGRAHSSVELTCFRDESLARILVRDADKGYTPQCRLGDHSKGLAYHVSFSAELGTDPASLKLTLNAGHFTPPGQYDLLLTTQWSRATESYEDTKRFKLIVRNDYLIRVADAAPIVGRDDTATIPITIERSTYHGALIFDLADVNAQAFSSFQFFPRETTDDAVVVALTTSEFAAPGVYPTKVIARRADSGLEKELLLNIEVQIEGGDQELTCGEYATEQLAANDSHQFALAGGEPFVLDFSSADLKGQWTLRDPFDNDIATGAIVPGQRRRHLSVPAAPARHTLVVEPLPGETGTYSVGRACAEPLPLNTSMEMLSAAPTRLVAFDLSAGDKIRPAMHVASSTTLPACELFDPRGGNLNSWVFFGNPTHQSYWTDALTQSATVPGSHLAMFYADTPTPAADVYNVGFAQVPAASSIAAYPFVTLRTITHLGAFHYYRFVAAVGDVFDVEVSHDGGDLAANRRHAATFRPHLWPAEVLRGQRHSARISAHKHSRLSERDGQLHDCRRCRRRVCPSRVGALVLSRSRRTGVRRSSRRSDG